MNRKNTYMLIAALLVIAVAVGVICSEKRSKKEKSQSNISQDISSSDATSQNNSENAGSGVAIPDTVGMRLNDAATIYNELGIITDITYVDDENSQNTVLSQSSTYIENPMETSLEITVSKNKVEYGSVIPQTEIPNVTGKSLEEGLADILYLNMKYELVPIPLTLEQITEDTKLDKIVAERINEKYYSENVSDDFLKQNDKNCPDELISYDNPDGGSPIAADENDVICLYFYTYQDNE